MSEVSLQWGRDFSVAEGCARHKDSGAELNRFNGAATLVSRKAPSPPPTTPRRSSSFNGAATLVSRKGLVGGADCGQGVWLQWGRDFSVAEGTRPSPRWSRHGGFNGAATLVSRKDGPSPSRFLFRAQLQWGRDFSVAEGSSSVCFSLRTVTLQWGRDFSVAEGGAIVGPGSASASFNGAATLVSRKVASRSRARRGAPCFNGAATLVSRKARASAIT